MQNEPGGRVLRLSIAEIKSFEALLLLMSAMYIFLNKKTRKIQEVEKLLREDVIGSEHLGSLEG